MSTATTQSAAPFDRAAVAAACAALPAALPGVEWIADGRVERLSQDFNWYSPVLKRQLAALRADIAVRPKSEDEIRAVVAACARAGVPITLRGSGTGNYGQCVPLHGGVILDLSACNRLLWHRGGVARAQCGIRMMEMDRRTQLQPQQPDADGSGANAIGWELRCVPSTYRSATLGGLYGGGFGGVGSINHGPLAAAGNVLGIRAMSVEPEPQTVELRSPDALLLHHAYGTNGIVLELEVALAPAHPWLEAVVCFDAADDDGSCAGFDAAMAFADRLASAPGIVKKSVTLFAAPVPDLLLQALPTLAGSMAPRAHAVVVLVAEAAEPALLQLAAQHGGKPTFRKTAADVRASNRTLVETTWNHTTLHAMKVDKSLTYIQSGYTPGQHVQQATALRKRLGDEVLVHLEFIRNADGLMTCAGLQLVRYGSDARLDAVMQVHRDHGVAINNPHVYIVEDGKQGQVNAAVVAMKQRFDPAGLLNPGKLRGWDERHAAARGAAMQQPPTTGEALSTLRRF